MALRDLREFLKALEAKGELKRVTASVHWDGELGAIAEEAIRRNLPALLFENIIGYEDTHGRKVLVNTSATSLTRVLMAVGLPEDTHPLDAIKILRARCKNPIKPLSASTGPCKEVIEKGGEVDLFEFPTPKWHSLDGGRYIQTCGGVITRDPETGWVNIGTYRGMLVGKDSLSMPWHPASHWGIHARKYKALGKTMPMAITIGADAISPHVFSAPFPQGVCEYDIVGAIRQEPLEVVGCETVDLPVPASSEIVLEGEVSLDGNSFIEEGPFGEYSGYYSSLIPERRPVFKVHCVTHRRDPILHGCDYLGLAESYPGVRPYSFIEVIPIWDLLEAQGVQGITGVYGGDAHPTSHAVIFISIDKTYYGQERQVAAALWGNLLSSQMGKIVVVVDSDVDITDPARVWAAIANRTRPQEDILIFPGCFGGSIDPSVTPELRRATGGIGRWDRVLINATWPLSVETKEEWGGLRHPMPCLAEEPVIQKVRQRWTDYGLG